MIHEKFVLIKIIFKPDHYQVFYKVSSICLELRSELPDRSD
jgi:hypothetical protein